MKRCEKWDKVSQSIDSVYLDDAFNFMVGEACKEKEKTVTVSFIKVLAVSLSVLVLTAITGIILSASIGGRGIVIEPLASDSSYESITESSADSYVNPPADYHPGFFEDKIRILYDGSFQLTCLFALITPIFGVVILWFEKKRISFIIGFNIILYILTVTVFRNFFPLKWDYDFEDFLTFGFIHTNIFYGYPSNIIDFITIAFRVQFFNVTFGFLMGILIPVVFRSARKLRFTFIYLAGILFLTETSKVLPNIITGHLNKVLDLEGVILTVMFYAFGFLVFTVIRKLIEAFRKPPYETDD